MHLIRSVAAALVVAALALPFAGSATGQPAAGDVVQTQWGPLGPADRDTLVKVHLAGLWEGPGGRLGLQKSTNLRVQEAGRHLIEGHSALDRRNAELAALLKVELPAEMNASQQGWIDEMTAAPAGSQEFDRIFANRLRAAHGVVYKFLAQVRTGTRNDLIRDFAEQCMVTVLDHITVLEATGMVNFDDVEAIPLGTVPPPPNASSAPTPEDQAVGRAAAESGLGNLVVVGVIVLLVLITLVGVAFVVFRGRRAARRPSL